MIFSFCTVILAVFDQKRFSNSNQTVTWNTDRSLPIALLFFSSFLYVIVFWTNWSFLKFLSIIVMSPFNNLYNNFYFYLNLKRDILCINWEYFFWNQNRYFWIFKFIFQKDSKQPECRFRMFFVNFCTKKTPIYSKVNRR